MALYIVEIPDEIEKSIKEDPDQQGVSVPQFMAAMVNHTVGSEVPDQPPVRFFEPSTKLREVLQAKISGGCAEIVPNLDEDLKPVSS